MSLPPLDSTLTQLIQEAWDSVQAHPEARLRPSFRLRIYDRLVEQPDGTFYKLCIKEQRESLKSYAFRRYHHLGIITATSVLFKWNQDYDLFLAVIQWSDDEGVRHFPETILNSARMVLEGKSDQEINKIIVEENVFADTIPGWHYMIGNLGEEFVYSQYMALCATYDAYLATIGISTLYLSYNPHSFATLEDSDIDRLNNHDFAYHACEAVCTHDPNPPGYRFENLKPLPIERNNQKALEFWQWWLFEAVPQAWHSVPEI